MTTRVALLALCGACAAGAVRADILKGVVRDSSGAPVVNANFDVFTPDGTFLPADDNTDADGSYRLNLDAGHYRIECFPLPGSGLAPRAIQDVSVSGITRMDWVLARSARVIGRVLGPGNAPVANADLNYDRILDGVRQPASGDKTSPFGTFASYIEPGPYRLTVTPPIATDLAPAWRAELTVPTRDTLRFVLSRAAHLAGSVRDAGGAAVPDARLSFRRAADDERVPAWGRTTDAAGAFRAGVAPDTYRVLIQAPRGARFAAVRLEGFDLTADRRVDVILPAGVIVSGTVLDRARLPVLGATWDAVDEATLARVPTPDDMTDYNGRFAFALPRGVYRLRLNPPSGSGLDSLEFRGVRVERDTALDVLYRDPTAPAPSAIELFPLGTPTHRRATLRLVLPRAGPTRVEIFDAAGCRVRRLADEWLPAGLTDLPWDGNRQRGERAHTGLYFVRAIQGNERAVTRFILLP